MPRAKRTDRAEARRRYRAQLAEEGVEPVDGDGTDAAATTAPRASRPGGRPAPARGASQAPAQQGGIGYAFRAAFRPANLREDIAYLPTLIRSRAVLVPLLAIAATAVLFIGSRGTEIVSALLAQYFLFPPPIGAIFIAGFFAARASYLAGAIVGVAAAIGLTVAAFTIPPGSLGTAASPGVGPGAAPSAIVSPAASGSAAPSASALASAGPSASAPASAAASPSTGASASGAGSALPAASPGASPDASPAPAASASPEQVAAYSFLISPLTGIFFASAAAWYRRFLRLANPNRAAQRSSNKRPQQRRR